MMTIIVKKKAADPSQVIALSQGTKDNNEMCQTKFLQKYDMNVPPTR